ncbi:TPA: hypothetical protein PC505_003925 [Morganella morganii]|nr:hypothetical protein [Morganella morganii]HDF2424470.1 hypothetical protein [Morganella morganii]
MNKKNLKINVLRWILGVSGVCVMFLSTIHVLPNLVDYMDFIAPDYTEIMNIYETFNFYDLNVYDNSIFHNLIVFWSSYLLNIVIIYLFFVNFFPLIKITLFFKRNGFKGFKKYLCISKARSARRGKEFNEAVEKESRKEKRRKKYSESRLHYVFLGLFLGFIFFK